MKNLRLSELQSLQMSNPWNYEQVKIDWVFRRSICFCCEKCGLIFHLYSWSHDFFRANICCHFNHLLFFFFPFKKEEQFLAWFLQHGLLDFFFQLEVWFFFLRIHFILSNEGGPYQKINSTKVVQISEQMDSKVNHLFCISIY